MANTLFIEAPRSISRAIIASCNKAVALVSTGCAFAPSLSPSDVARETDPEETWHRRPRDLLGCQPLPGACDNIGCVPPFCSQRAIRARAGLPGCLLPLCLMVWSPAMLPARGVVLDGPDRRGPQSSQTTRAHDQRQRGGRHRRSVYRGAIGLTSCTLLSRACGVTRRTCSRLVEPVCACAPCCAFAPSHDSMSDEARRGCKSQKP